VIYSGCLDRTHKVIADGEKKGLKKQAIQNKTDTHTEGGMLLSVTRMWGMSVTARSTSNRHPDSTCLRLCRTGTGGSLKHTTHRAAHTHGHTRTHATRGYSHRFHAGDPKLGDQLVTRGGNPWKPCLPSRPGVCPYRDSGLREVWSHTCL
jgi:hypothetical protein